MKISPIINMREGVDPFVIDREKEIENLNQILFTRYNKILLIKSKCLKPPKNLRTKDYQEIIKYL
jgi:hypothetical protein